MILCPKCNHDNDLGRIFCSKCGEKLDITRVGPPSGVSRRARKGGKSLSKRLTLAFNRLIKVIFLALFVAIVTLIWLPPDLQLKPFDDLKFVDAYQAKHAQLEEAINSKQDAEVVFDEADINVTMAQAVEKTKKAAGESKRLQLNGVYFSLSEGMVTVTAEHKWKWFRLTVQLEAKPVDNGGKWEFLPTTARIGRLRVAPYFGGKGPDDFSLQKISDVVKKLLSDCEPEKKLLEGVSGITIKPGQIVLTTKKDS